MMGFGVSESPCQCCVTLGHFIHLSEPPFLLLSAVGSTCQCATLYAQEAHWSLCGMRFTTRPGGKRPPQ